MTTIPSHPTLQAGSQTRLEVKEIAIEDFNEATSREPLLRVHTAHIIPKSASTTSNTPSDYENPTTPPSAGHFTFNVEYDGSDAEPSPTAPSLTSSSSTAPSPWSEVPTPSPCSSSSVLSLPSDPVSPSPAKTRRKARIPRPSNAFILFRKEYTQNHRDDLRHNQPQLSKAAAQVWRQLSAKGRATYQRMAEKVKEDHERMHPGYVYSPARKNTKQPKKKDTRCCKERPARIKPMNTSPVPSVASPPAFITFPVKSAAQSSVNSDVSSALFALPPQQTEVMLPDTRLDSIFTSDFRLPSSQVLIENEMEPMFLESYSNVDFIDLPTSIGYPKQGSTYAHVDPFYFDFEAYCGDGGVVLGSQQGNLVDGYPDVPAPSLYTYTQPETVPHYGHYLDDAHGASYHAQAHPQLQAHVLPVHEMSNMNIHPYTLGLEPHPYDPHSHISLDQYPVNQYSNETCSEYDTYPLFPIDNSQAAVFPSSFGF